MSLSCVPPRAAARRHAALFVPQAFSSVRSRSNYGASLFSSAKPLEDVHLRKQQPKDDEENAEEDRLEEEDEEDEEEEEGQRTHKSQREERDAPFQLTRKGSNLYTFNDKYDAASAAHKAIRKVQEEHRSLRGEKDAHASMSRLTDAQMYKVNKLDQDLEKQAKAFEQRKKAEEERRRREKEREEEERQKKKKSLFWRWFT
ncbi:Myosin motor domain-containing protein [Balamuthia mandrillaris]